MPRVYYYYIHGNYVREREREREREKERKREKKRERENIPVVCVPLRKFLFLEAATKEEDRGRER